MAQSLISQEKEKEKKTHPLIQWSKNGFRVIFFPVTQIFMAIGIFPAQFISLIKKTPILGAFIGFLTRKIFKKDSRTAAETYHEDFLHQTAEIYSGFGSSIINWFRFNPKAKVFDSRNLEVNPKEMVNCATDFGRTIQLETFSFQHQDFKNKALKEQYYRLHCSGNSGNCSRFFEELALLSQKHPELKTITYNHPGVEGSGGLMMTQDDLVNALYAQVKNLIANGVKPEHIELSGFSIGAATAALTAKKLKDECYNVNLFCDRTFSTMSKVVTDKLPIFGTILKFLRSLPILKEIINYLIQPLVQYILIKPLLWLMNWDMNPAEAYKGIDPHQKALVNVKPKSQGDGWLKTIGKYFGQFTGFFKLGNGDKTIDIHASLLEGTEDKTKKNEWKQILNKVSGYNKPTAIGIQLARLENLADNAISAHAIAKIRKSNNPLNVDENQALLSLAKLGDKARRLGGTKESDAHNVTADVILSRESDEQGRRFALRAAGLDEEAPLNLLTYYSLFHKAIQSHHASVEEGLKPVH